MYKVIENEMALLQWEQETKAVLSLWENHSAVSRIREMVKKLDIHYGVHRDLEADLGGYTIILYGEQKEIEKEYSRILEYHLLQEDWIECEDNYENGESVIVIRLFLCSSDYAVVICIIDDKCRIVH